MVFFGKKIIYKIVDNGVSTIVCCLSVLKHEQVGPTITNAKTLEETWHDFDF